MAVMMGNLYDAPRSVGADDGTARKAPAETAAYDNRFAKVESDVAFLKWMVGFNNGLTLVAGLVLPPGGLR